MRPYDVKNEEQLLTMESDNFPGEPDRFSIMHTGETVSIHRPGGEGYIRIPRDEFNDLVDWYLTDQPATPST